MLENTRITAFTVSELLRENQQGSKLPLVLYIHKLNEKNSGWY